MNPIPQDMKDFLLRSHIFALATTDKSHRSHSAPVFYVYDGQTSLYFYSTRNTQHAINFIHNNQVSGAIYRDVWYPEDIVGIQANGQISAISPDIFPNILAMYCNRFDYLNTTHSKIKALINPDSMWSMQLQSLKYVNNSKQFGFKELWQN